MKVSRARVNTGYTLSAAQVEHKGLSGPVAFKEGRRVQFKLDLLKLKQHALVKVGEWSPRQGVNITDHEAFFDAGTMNVTLVVVTILVSSAAIKNIKNKLNLKCWKFKNKLLQSLMSFCVDEPSCLSLKRSECNSFEPCTRR